MVTSLRVRPSLTHLKYEAKQLLRAHKKGQIKARSILLQLRRFKGMSDEELLAAPLALHEAQYALALHYGFGSWRQLRDHVIAIRQKDARVEPEQLNKHGLWATIDAVDDSLFFSAKMSTTEKRQLAEFIASRQGLAGSYYGRLFAPMEDELAKGLRVFTGERVSPGPGAKHILGQEALRTLVLLGVEDQAVASAMNTAWQSFPGSIKESLARPVGPVGALQPGMFCCMKCSCAVWRHLAARKDRRHERLLNAGVRALRMYRDGEGGWKFWPFYYTLLTLREIGSYLAHQELRYASTACERELSKRMSKTNVYSRRRRALLERVLGND